MNFIKNYDKGLVPCRKLKDFSNKSVEPIITPVRCYFHTFYVPARLLPDDFEKFINGFGLNKELK